MTQIDVDGNIYFGFDADVFIDIKVGVAVTVDFVGYASALNAIDLCSFDSVVV